MRRAVFIWIISLLALESQSQECIEYVLHFQSNVTAGGPSAIFYNITGAGLAVGSGSANFDINNAEQIDTLCMTAGCNLSITIDASTWPADNSFDFQIWALGAPLQLANYNSENGLIQATFCCTLPCPSQIQSQMLDCDSYSFYVDASFGNVSWDFGDTSNDPMGNYQLHNYTQNGFFNVLATVDAPGCGPAYILNVPININCDTTLNCPSALVIEPLTCQDYYIHFDFPVPGLVEWQIDGMPMNNGFSEITVNWENGLHEVIATYFPTGPEGCPQNLPITFWDTLTVDCISCQEVFIGLSSVLDLQGPGSVTMTLVNDDNTFLATESLNFTSANPVVDLNYCLADDCYQIHLCAPTPIADTNFFVDFVEPLQFETQESFYVESCFGRDVFFSLNTDCSSPNCDGEWLTLSVDASYLTVPPFFSPDTLYWNVVSIDGIEMAQGALHVNDAWPTVSDSVCMPLPLTCYQVSVWVTDQQWGMTYANVSATLMDTTIYGMINPNSNTWIGSLVIVPGMNCFSEVEAINETSMLLMPNPCHSTLNVPVGVDVVEIFALTGNLISRHSTKGATTLDVSALPNGIWLVKTHGENGQFWTQRIVKL